MKSLRYLYKIGNGPSSSHTMGPEYASHYFLDVAPDADNYKVVLYGSLALTGKGHLTDVSIKEVFGERDVEIVFNTEEKDLPHENTLDFVAYKNGEIIAKHNLDKQYYSEIIKNAFLLDTFGVSEVINVNTGYEDAYVILYRTVKTSDHFSDCYDSIASAYVQNEIGKIIDTDATSIKEGLQSTDILKELDRGAISME